MDHRAAILAIALPIASYLGVLHYPYYARQAEHVLRAAFAWVG
jgi:hypothetical protein